MSVPNSDLPTSILFCRLCQSLYRSPRTLPCLHSFCLECLRHVAPVPGSGSGLAPRGEPPPALLLPCPLCGQHAPLPADAGAAGLMRNDFLVRMCREYVEEVQKTLVSGRSLSPAPVGTGGFTGTGIPGQGGSPASVLAGRAPVSQFQYPSSSQFQPHSPSSQFKSSTSPVGVSGSGWGGGGGHYYHHHHGYRALSPPHSPRYDPPSSSFHHPGQRGSWGPGAGGDTGHLHASPSPSTATSTPGYLSPSGLPSSPRHSSSSTASEAVLQTARRMSSESLPSRGLGVHRRLSSTPQNVVRTWECLQRKLNSLQSASLQVTYSLETVNMAEANWHQRKQDLRRDVQRRSAQLQFFIKRQERLLLAALDAKKTDDSFSSVAEQARGELRTNLKSLMHETDVIRSVLDLATDAEIVSLSSLLLGSRVSQAPVSMEAPELRFVVPEELSLEDMVGRDFGCLTSTLLSHAIFAPEDIAQELPEDPEEVEDDPFSQSTSIHVSSAASPTPSDRFDNGFEDVAYIDEDEDEDEDEEVVVEETLELIDGRMQVVSKRSIPVAKKPRSAPRRAQKDDDDDSKDHGQRGRATDIRRTANSSTTTSSFSTTTSLSKEHAWPHAAKRQGSERSGEKHTTTTKEDQAVPGTSPPDDSHPPNSIEKFQNLRESLKQKRRELLLNTALFPPEGPPGMAHLLRGEKRVQSLDRTGSVREDWHRSFSPSAPKRPQEPSVAAPVIVTPTHPGPKNITERGGGSSSSNTLAAAGVVVSEAGGGGGVSGTMVVTPPLMFTSLVSPPQSMEDRTSRPVRRAISAASDRASKMEYLRETWRKRKELLIQNEGYIPAAAATTTTSPTEDGGNDGGNASTGDAAQSPNKEAEGEGEGEGVAPPVGHHHKSKIKQSLRSRFSNLKQALKKNGKSEDSPQQAKTGDCKGGLCGTGNGSERAAASSTTTMTTMKMTTTTTTAAADKPALTPSRIAAQAAAEKKVLKTIESILMKKAAPSTESKSSSSSRRASAPSTQSGLSDLSPGSKPSMVVKPCPREPLDPAAAAVSTSTAAGPLPLEPLPEDEDRAAQAARLKPGLRVTSPVRGEAGKESLQHMRANIRQKKERWRSLSLN